MIEEYTERPHCNGEGVIFIDTRNQCFKHASECCGGCGYNIPCQMCEGSGEFKPEEE